MTEKDNGFTKWSELSGGSPMYVWVWQISISSADMDGYKVKPVVMVSPGGATDSLNVCTNCENTAPTFWQWTAP